MCEGKFLSLLEGIKTTLTKYVRNTSMICCNNKCRRKKEAEIRINKTENVAIILDDVYPHECF
jgi:hypothetical protein